MPIWVSTMQSETRNSDRKLGPLFIRFTQQR
jgi:hypothetical protein